MPIDVKVRMMANCSEPSAEICVDGGFWNGPANAFYAHGENYYKTYPKGESWESRRSGEFNQEEREKHVGRMSDSVGYGRVPCSYPYALHSEQRADHPRQVAGVST
jgi:hypothetical protein